jgi:hypothetical protein
MPQCAFDVITLGILVLVGFVCLRVGRAGALTDAHDAVQKLQHIPEGARRAVIHAIGELF